MSGPSYKLPEMPAHRYEPAGWCIYCDTPEAPTVLLSEEHIIPLSFGGRLVLPKASCPGCRRAIDPLESRCFNGMLGAARDHMGLKGRQKLKKRDQFQQRYRRDGWVQTEKVGLDDHIAFIYSPPLPPPGFLARVPPTKALGASAYIGYIVLDKARHIENVKKAIQRGWGGAKLDLFVTPTPVDVQRLIAKIAHAFATAELGAHAFEPWLLGLILNIEPEHAGWLIGGVLKNETPSLPVLHQIKFAKSMRWGDRELIIVSLRLFANHPGTPVYWAAVGLRAMDASSLAAPDQGDKRDG